MSTGHRDAGRPRLQTRASDRQASRLSAIVTPLPVKAADGKTYKDLTAHPWAGLPVVVTLAAKDEAGHVGNSAPRGLILPERKFTKPLSKAVVAQRRSLVENPGDTPLSRATSTPLASAPKTNTRRRRFTWAYVPPTGG